MRCLAWYVSHLKCVEGDKHAIKNFDRELECKTPCLAKAAGIEAVIPCKCALDLCITMVLHFKIHVALNFTADSEQGPFEQIFGLESLWYLGRAGTILDTC